ELGFRRSESGQLHHHSRDEHQFFIGGPVKHHTEPAWRKGECPDRPKIRAAVPPVRGADGHGDLAIPPPSAGPKHHVRGGRRPRRGPGGLMRPQPTSTIPYRGIGRQTSEAVDMKPGSRELPNLPSLSIAHSGANNGVPANLDGTHGVLFEIGCWRLVVGSWWSEQANTQCLLCLLMPPLNTERPTIISSDQC